MNYKLNHSIEIIGSTPLDFDHSVGFHDIRPFNKIKNNLIVLHRYPLKSLGFKGDNNDKIDICLWDFFNSKIEKIDETNIWSWEQGSRLQWLDETNLIFNQSQNQDPSSVIYNTINNKSRKLNTCVYSTNNNGLILSINYSRLWKLWRSYGYNKLNDISKNINEKKPNNDGIFLSDLNNNRKLILSIDRAVKLCGLENINRDFFLCHPTFNPSGDKFISLLRYFNDSGALISYLICTDIKKEKNIILVREKVSHFEWINDKEIFVWCRNLNQKIIKLRNNSFLEKKIFPSIRKILNFSGMNIKNKILTNDYHLINIEEPSKIIRLNNKSLNEDGHPQISPDKKFLITDTYADNKGYMKLLLLNINTKKVYVLGEFKIAEYLKKNNLKYDLHPRWDNSGSLISIDSSHVGSRQSFILNIEKLLLKLKNGKY